MADDTTDAIADVILQAQLAINAQDLALSLREVVERIDRNALLTALGHDDCDRLREALELIADPATQVVRMPDGCNSIVPGRLVEIARAALDGEG